MLLEHRARCANLSRIVVRPVDVALEFSVPLVKLVGLHGFLTGQ